jgi:1-acyl-sn-glycerol-3-phosphate acyltransferase
MMLGQRIINIILRPLIALLLPYDVQGAENLPQDGPVLVIMNHINFIDVVFPGLFLPRDVVMLSKVENFRLPFLGFFVRLHGSLPVRRGEPDLEALRRCLDVLKRGRVLVIAPEGTRSGQGRLQFGHDGLAFVATQANVPVVPMVSYGHEHFRSNIRQLRRTHVHICVGRPFRFRAKGRLRRNDLHSMTEESMYRLAELLPPDYRGAYADLSQASSRCIEPYTPSKGAGH